MEPIYVAITDAPIDVMDCLNRVEDPKHGARVLFLGVVRDHNLGKRVRAVSYDVFEPLALTTFRQIAESAKREVEGTLRCLIIHRRGRLGVGEASIAIVVSSPHRDEAYRGSRVIIEAVKHQAPIWKKEHYEGGDSEWVQGHSLCAH
jgi:molybdopterin synthase catalytic subunit